MLEKEIWRQVGRKIAHRVGRREEGRDVEREADREGGRDREIKTLSNSHPYKHKLLRAKTKLNASHFDSFSVNTRAKRWSRAYFREL